MSVVLLGMKMPQDCNSCIVSDGYDWVLCRVTGRFWDIDQGQQKRPDWCPLRPLPEKHGRLGDLDELQSSFRESIDECKKWIKELEENGDNETLVLANQAFCTFVEAAMRLKSIPTIVEAEGDDGWAYRDG